MFRQGNLFDIFSRQSEGRDVGDIAPDAAARARAEAEGRPVDVFNTKDHSSARVLRERLQQSLQSGSLMGSGFEGANDKKAKEERRMRDEWLERAVMGRMTASQWLAQTRNVAGVNMTVGEIMDARKKILEKPDFWAQWAVEHGHIKKGEESAFIQAIRRKQEIDEYRMNHGGAYESPEMEKEDKRIDKEFGAKIDPVVKEAHSQYNVDVGLKESDKELPSELVNNKASLKDEFNATDIEIPDMVDAPSPASDIGMDKKLYGLPKGLDKA